MNLPLRNYIELNPLQSNTGSSPANLRLMWLNHKLDTEGGASVGVSSAPYDHPGLKGVECHRDGVNMPRKEHDTRLDTVKACAKAALAAKVDSDKALDLLVDDVRSAHSQEELYQTANLLRLVLDISRRADVLWQWAALAWANNEKIPKEKIDELKEIQLTLDAYLHRKSDGA
jgi:hypothetical protein